MLYIRKASQRGHANFGWLNSYHSFSFGQYYDPSHMGFSNLRVINDDTVEGGMGFGTHRHDNMEIISYVTQGSIVHKDSMGNHFSIPAGDVQRMSAGTGIMHSEFNASENEDVKFLQIWIQPNVHNVPPSYEQNTIKQDGVMTPLVTPNGKDNSLSIHADAELYRLQLNVGDTFLIRGINKHNELRNKYLHIVNGELKIDEETYGPGDGIGLFGGDEINLTAIIEVEALLFDLPSIHSLA